jgi:hypothetical protein
MGGDRLYDDPDLAQFYDLENGWAADLDYCRSRFSNSRLDCAALPTAICG